MTGGMVAARNQQNTTILHSLDLAIEDTKLRRIAFVIGGVDGKQRRLYPIESWRKVVIARRIPLIEMIVGVAYKGSVQALIEQLIGLLAVGRRFE